MKWKGRPQNMQDIEDVRLDPLPDIPEGAPMIHENRNWKNTPGVIQSKNEENARRDVARRGDNVPTPTPRPTGPKDNGSHDNLVTPGKWNTKTSK